MQSSIPPESVLKHAQALQEAIDRLTEQRKLLLQDANIHPPPSASDLPNEILSHIFQYACQDPLPYADTPFIVEYIQDIDIESHDGDKKVSKFRKPFSFPIVLGNVCSRWRGVVRSKPECWTKLDIEVFCCTLNEVVHLVSLHLKNSAQLTLEIQFDFRRQQKLAEEEYPQRIAANLEPLRKLVFDEHSSRFEKMQLLFPPYSWQKMESNASNLHSVSLAYVIAKVELQQLPRLTHVFLCSISTCDLPWKQLTTLEMARMAYDSCVWILKECEVLRSVKMLEAHPPIDMEYSNNIPVITLKHLESFEWSFPREMDVYHNNCALEKFRLPAVKSIVFRELFARISSHRYELRYFYPTLPKSLSSMTFDFRHILQFYDGMDADSWNDDLLGYIQSTPRSVTHLRFEGTCLDFLADFFRHMLWRLPELSHLEIVNAPDVEHSCTFPHFHGTTRSSGCYRNFLTEMADVSGLKNGFCLGVHGYGNGGNWKTSFERINREFREKGFNVSFEHSA